MARRRWAWAGPALVALVAPAIALPLAFVVWRGTADDATSPAARTHAGLCAALDVAASDDVTETRAVFYDRSHDGLHELAAEANRVDTTAAARLLQAKYRVEALLEEAPGPADLTRALAALAEATAGAADVVGEGDVTSCG